MMTYNCGVASIFHQGHVVDEDNCVPYVGTLKEILLLHYGPIPTPTFSCDVHG
jgi:hypothetical protein